MAAPSTAELGWKKDRNHWFFPPGPVERSFNIERFFEPRQLDASLQSACRFAARRPRPARPLVASRPVFWQEYRAAVKSWYVADDIASRNLRLKIALRHLMRIPFPPHRTRDVCSSLNSDCEGSGPEPRNGSFEKCSLSPRNSFCWRIPCKQHGNSRSRDRFRLPSKAASRFCMLLGQLAHLPGGSAQASTLLRKEHQITPAVERATRNARFDVRWSKLTCSLRRRAFREQRAIAFSIQAPGSRPPASHTSHWIVDRARRANVLLQRRLTGAQRFRHRESASSRTARPVREARGRSRFSVCLVSDHRHIQVSSVTYFLL